jgi:hypothetical protein
MPHFDYEMKFTVVRMEGQPFFRHSNECDILTDRMYVPAQADGELVYIRGSTGRLLYRGTVETSKVSRRGVSEEAHFDLTHCGSGKELPREYTLFARQFRPGLTLTIHSNPKLDPSVEFTNLYLAGLLYSESLDYPSLYVP